MARVLSARACCQGLALLQAGSRAPTSAVSVAGVPTVWSRGMAGQEYLQSRFPKGSFSASQTLGRPAGMRPPVVTSDQVFDPYAGVPPGVNGLSLVTTGAGWRYLFQRAKSAAQNTYALAMAHRHCKPFRMPAFKEEALRVYEEINEHVAAGDRRALIASTAPNMNALFKRQIKAREDAGWTHVEWGLAERPGPGAATVVQGRAAMGDPKDKNTGFVQFTIRFRTQQRFQAFSRDGRLLAGGADPVDVEELWVLERPFKEQDINRWRLVGKLFPVPGTQQYTCSAPVATQASADEIRAGRRVISASGTADQPQLAARGPARRRR